MHSSLLTCVNVFFQYPPTDRGGRDYPVFTVVGPCDYVVTFSILQRIEGVATVLVDPKGNETFAFSILQRIEGVATPRP